MFLTGLRINNIPVEEDSSYIVKRNFEKISAVTIPYDRGVLSLEFLALEFTGADKIQYAYMLEGWDKDWNSQSWVPGSPELLSGWKQAYTAISRCNDFLAGLAKADKVPFSKISNDFNSVQTRRAFTASETHFLLAEAALRGWTGAGVAKTNYENGVKLSFADWGASGADAYLADATSTPIAYVDPTDAASVKINPSNSNSSFNKSLMTLDESDAGIVSVSKAGK
jgi:hypothetical protein